MNSLFRNACANVTRLSLAACVYAAAVASASAALTNKYTFNDGTANDSIGGKNGVLIGTNGSYVAGQLVLANTGESSQNPGATGAYVDFPNNLISNAAVSGSTNSVSVEMWVTMLQNRDWAAAFSAGTSVNGEGTSDCCNDDQPYIQIIPRTGDGGQG